MRISLKGLLKHGDRFLLAPQPLQSHTQIELQAGKGGIELDCAVR